MIRFDAPWSGYATAGPTWPSLARRCLRRADRARRDAEGAARGRRGRRAALPADTALADHGERSIDDEIIY